MKGGDKIQDDIYIERISAEETVLGFIMICLPFVFLRSNAVDSRIIIRESADYLRWRSQSSMSVFDSLHRALFWARCFGVILLWPRLPKATSRSARKGQLLKSPHFDLTGGI